MLDAEIKTRIARALSYEQPDRVPTCDVLHNPRLIKYFSPGAKSSREAAVQAYHQLGVDVCWRFERRQQTRRGRFHQWLSSPVARPLPAVSIPEREIDQEMEDFRSQQREFEPFTYLAMCADGILRVVYQNLGKERFTKQMYQDPLALERLFDVQAENLFLRAQAFCRSGGGLLFFVNDAVAEDKDLLFSEHFLAVQWVPRLRRAIQPLKEQGVKVVLHAQGGISHVLDMLVDAGIDGVHPVSAAAAGKFERVFGAYYGKLVMFAGIPLGGKDPAAVTQMVQDILSQGPRTGIFMGAHTIIDSSCPLANILAFYNTVK